MHLASNIAYKGEQCTLGISPSKPASCPTSISCCHWQYAHSNLPANVLCIHLTSLSMIPAFDQALQISASRLATAVCSLCSLLWGKHEGDGMQLTLLQSMGSGFSAACLGPVCTGPFDVIKVSSFCLCSIVCCCCDESGKGSLMHSGAQTAHMANPS